ncbi:MAG: biosynthetic-type acetolactate synthase large subunit [Oscillospiraceae bacterium]|nr:biosynthetic-type acetolactate synthase large subunit [Oscillospiraceae bacterium]
MTGAQALIQSLKNENVTHMFGYAGATICPAYDALKNTDGIGYTLVRVEQNAGHMASGYARVSGKVGVAMVTSGPGATNLITGIATAYLDSIPLVCITGQVPSNLLGHDIFQEVDITGAVEPFIKHSYLLKDARDIPRVVKEAFYIASTGRPGPVLIDIPKDVQDAEIDYDYPESVSIRGYRPQVQADEEQIDMLCEAITNAERPLILAGGGVMLADARKELIALSEATGIPVATTMMGLSILPTDHPMNMGMVGVFGHKAANMAMNMSDLLILIGSRAADRAIPNAGERQAMTIHIDVDPAEIGKNIPNSLSVIGDVKAVIAQVSARAPKADSRIWVEELRARRKQDLSWKGKEREGSVNPGNAMKILGDKLDSDAFACIDVGQNQIWASKYLTLKENTRFLTTGGLGTMGYSLPAAIGAKVADPSKQTVVVCGDGSFQMFMNELSSLRSEGFDVKIVMVENNVLGLVHQIQRNAYSGPFGVDLTCPPDWAKLADAYGVAFDRVSNDADVPAAIDKMLAAKGPYLLCLKTDEQMTTND